MRSGLRQRRPGGAYYYYGSEARQRGYALVYPVVAINERAVSVGEIGQQMLEAAGVIQDKVDTWQNGLPGRSIMGWRKRRTPRHNPLSVFTGAAVGVGIFSRIVTSPSEVQSARAFAAQQQRPRTMVAVGTASVCNLHAHFAAGRSRASLSLQVEVPADLPVCRPDSATPRLRTVRDTSSSLHLQWPFVEIPMTPSLEFDDVRRITAGLNNQNGTATLYPDRQAPVLPELFRVGTVLTLGNMMVQEFTPASVVAECRILSL